MTEDMQLAVRALSMSPSELQLWVEGLVFCGNLMARLLRDHGGEGLPDAWEDAKAMDFLKRRTASGNP